MALFKPTTDGDYICNFWSERDRVNVRLETPRGRVIFDLRDDDVVEAIEDGLLPKPRDPRAAESDWQPCAVEYARSQGLIK